MAKKIEKNGFASHYRELLLGCGYSREKRMLAPNTLGNAKEWKKLTTVDNNADCLPDVFADLSDPFWCDIVREETGIDYFDEIHAYEVLEHLGQQGDFKAFFSTFTNIYSLLVNDGYLLASCPSRFGPWLWGDPGHTRAITGESLVFLDQTNYTAQIGRTAMSDYRFCYESDFRTIGVHDDKTTFSFILQAVKPSRIKK